MINPRVYVGTTVTVTATPTCISDLIQVILTKAGEQVCSELHITADAGNSGAMLVGDGSMTTTLYEKTLAAGLALVYGPFQMNSIPLANIYLMMVTGSGKANIGYITQ